MTLIDAGSPGSIGPLGDQYTTARAVASGSALAGAKNVELDTGGHFRVLAHPRVLAEVAVLAE